MLTQCGHVSSCVMSLSTCVAFCEEKLRSGPPNPVNLISLSSECRVVKAVGTCEVGILHLMKYVVHCTVPVQRCSRYSTYSYSLCMMQSQRSQQLSKFSLHQSPDDLSLTSHSRYSIVSAHSRALTRTIAHARVTCRLTALSRTVLSLTDSTGE